LKEKKQTKQGIQSTRMQCIL